MVNQRLVKLLILLLFVGYALTATGLAQPAAAAPDTILPTPPEVRLARRLQPALIARLQPVIDSARSSNLPVDPLVRKALEGDTKGAGDELIFRAVTALFDRMLLAQAILGKHIVELDYTAAAAAIYAGVDSTALLRLLTALPPREKDDPPVSLSVELTVLTDLIVRGVPPESASSVMARLVAAEVSGERLYALCTNVGRDIGVGVVPDEAMESWTRELFPDLNQRSHQRSIRRMQQR